MRISDSMRHENVRRAQQRASQQVMTATEEATSGYRVRSPKDDPGSFASTVAHDGVLARLDMRRKTLDGTFSDLTIAESALGDASALMSRARELALFMADGSVSASDRTLGAKEVAQVRQALVALANTSGAKGHVFGGTSVDTPPFTPAGAFVGNDAAIPVETGDNVFVRSNGSGALAFTAAGGRDIFQDLLDLENALATDNLAGIQAATGFMDQAHAQIVRSRSELGITMDRVRMGKSMAETTAVARQAARRQESEVDITEAYSRLVSASQGYERALEMTRRTLQSIDIRDFP